MLIQYFEKVYKSKIKPYLYKEVNLNLRLQFYYQKSLVFQVLSTESYWIHNKQTLAG